MTTYTTLDYKKFIYALGTRDVRRMTAKVLRAGLDSGTKNEILCQLEQVEGRLLLAAFFDGADDRDGTSL